MPAASAIAAALDALLPGDGLQVVPLEGLVRKPFDPGMGLLILPAGRASEPEPDEATGFDLGVLPGRHGHGSDALTLLQRLYPPDHRVVGISPQGESTVGTAEAWELERGIHLLPPVEPLANAASPHALAWLVARLRGADGCPWDAEQDHLSLRPYLLEEAYEVYDALERGSTHALAEELGDLLLQIVLHAQYGAEAGVFDLADVQRGVFSKIVRRHPHVFAGVSAGTTDQVIRNWERIKADERLAEAAAGDGDSAAKRGDVDMPAAFAGLSKSLPALAYADEMQGRAASLGYDWPDMEGVIDKIAEEATELLAAGTQNETAEEFGDLLFIMVNLGRKLGVDAEAALRAASRKFARRFAIVERLAEGRGLELRALGPDLLDELWQEAKRREATHPEEARIAKRPVPPLELPA